MAIPDYQTLMLPFLRLLADGKEHRAADAVEQLNDEFGLTPEERQQHLASGSQTVMRNRVGWVCTYLKKAALILS
ncbi:MAG: winged helix-turn-helix domain-containing protein, partial [Actinomycetota bacterium]|nr:winged helix-turn-helix domain-containing protein [Actinomycetota bacterium]